jgi:glycosyltransferase involved in cell wall biosynthesis
MRIGSAPAPESEAPTVSVVIPTRDRRASLERTLAALRDDRDLLEVIVVDDGSEDDTRRWLLAEAASWPALRPLSTVGVGINQARATGATCATGEVVLLLDDDVVPGAGLVAGHARHHRDREGILVSGYYPIADRGRLPATTRLAARWYEDEIGEVEADASLGLHQFWGGQFSIRRRDLDRAPLAVPEFSGPWRHGDREFGLRCRNAGLTHIFDRSLRAEHLFSRHLSQFRQDARNSGYGAVLVNHLHSDVLGPLPSSLLKGRHRALGPVLRLTDFALFYKVATATLALLLRVGDVIRIKPLADPVVRLLVLTERRRGARGCLAHLRQATNHEPTQGAPAAEATRQSQALA